MSPQMITGVFFICVGLLSQCIFASGKDPAVDACKPGWIQLNVSNETYTEGPVCIKIYSKNLTYLNAVKQCRSDGGELATILNEAYQVAVQGLLSKQKHWIGLSDSRFESSFRWVSGYPSLPAVFWAVNEPNDELNIEDCVAIDPSKRANESWVDEHCVQALPSVCMSAKFEGAPSSIVMETETGACPGGFFRMGNRCMKIITNETLNFDEARQQCRKLAPKLNGDLASVYSSHEQNILTAMMLKEATAVWIGLRLHPKTRSRVWVRGFYDVTFTNWKEDEPNGDTAEQCVMVYKRASSPGEWNDKSCDTKLGYICGADLDSKKKDKNDGPPFFTSEGGCKKGEIEFEGYCYNSPDAKFASYEEAEGACNNMSTFGHLATPHNAYEIAFTSAVMNYLKINYTLLGYRIKETSTKLLRDFQIMTADNSSDIGFESLKGVMFYDVKDISCIKSTADSRHKMSVTHCSQKDAPFKALCSYPLKKNPFHPDNWKSNCKKDWIAITGGRCIKMFDDMKTMSEANKTCGNYDNGSLLSILNAHDQQAAAKIAKSAGSGVWIGLEVSFSPADNSPSWRWSDGRPVLFLNWRANEPTPTSRSKKVESCVVLRHKSTDWNNVVCNKKMKYICSMPSSPPTVAPPTTSPSTSSPTTTSIPTTTPTTTPSKPKPKPKPLCSAGFTEGPSENCYKLVMKSKTWHEAEQYCQTHFKGHLVSIHKHSEQLHVNQLIKKAKLASSWIGLSDLHGPVENQFSYWSDHTPMTIMFMNKTQKSYFGNQDCVVFTPTESTFGVWNMKHCTTHAPGFICMLAPKKPVSPPPEPEPNSYGSYCSNGFVKFNKTCYGLVKDAANFTQANKKCKLMFPPRYRRFVHLARVNNVENNDFLLSLLSPIQNSNAWIGMHYEEESFHWIDNRPVHFTKWPVNMTSTNKKTTCVTLGASTVTILSGFWYARNCDEKFPFLCQAPLLEERPTSKLKCKAPYTLYPDGKTCYRLLKTPTTFDGGRKRCEADKKALGLKTAPALLSIDSVFEMSFFRAWMVESGAPLDRTVWIGLKLEKDKPVWKWTTGAPVDFTYTSGFPDDISGCYYMYVHRKVMKDAEQTNVYGMHPDPKCGNGDAGKRTTVCKYSLETKAVVPKPKECLAEKSGVTYNGHRAVTESGKACVRWDIMNDINVLVQLNQKIGGSDSNFCRNPAGKLHQRDRPYCYTTRGTSGKAAQWEHCDIPLCTTSFAGRVGSHSYVVAVAILVIVLLVTISFFVGVMLWRRTNTARGFIPYLRQHDPEGGTSFHNPIYTPAANC